MKIKHYILTACCLIFFLAACSDDPVEKDLTIPNITGDITNAGFEDDKGEVQSPKGWNITGDKDAVSVKKDGCIGSYALFYNSEAAYTVSTQQTIENLEDGIYDLEFYFQNSGGQEACYISAGSNSESIKMTSLQYSPKAWMLSIVKGIEVSGGKCTISINSNAKEGEWCKIDGLTLKKTDKKYTFLKGGDISQLNYIEKMGGKFFENGQEKDCLEILKNNGWNIARLRLYNDPGNPDFSPSNRLPKGVQDTEDILNLAKRAKQAGMQIQLTFHYSDYWTNPEQQNIPHEWDGLSLDDLKKALYDFTFDFMSRMKAQGTIPEFVALGNETNGGLLFPYGNYEHYDQAAEFFSIGYDAVKAVSPDSKVIIHLSNSGDESTYSYFFGEMDKYGAKYDIIGASYYPFWTGKTAGEVRNWANYISQKFDKDILIMEAGYNWNPTLPDHTNGQLTHNGPYADIYPSSPLGQKNFILELFNEIKKVKDGRVLGCLYWDPVFIEVPGVGWELGDKNYVSNTTLFNFQGQRLEVQDAFKYNN
jgi:arabinogalactan endo-1,4-beta-galactosidase